MNKSSNPRLGMLMVTAAVLTFAAASSGLPNQITFHDIAVNGGAGIDYRRVPSTINAIYEALKHQPTYSIPNDLVATPNAPRGEPGVAIFDFNNDGALDIFVTNGPGAGNKLYKNLLKETGRLEYVDVAVQAGVAVPEMDATGVCYGDINNDGYEDLYVLGRKEPNRLFINNRNDTAAAHIAIPPGRWATSTGMGSLIS